MIMIPEDCQPNSPASSWLAPMSSKISRRAALVLLGLALAAVVTLMLPVPQWRTGRLDVPPLSLVPGNQFADTAQRIWIDTDAACGTDRCTDPDDCFAILLLANTSDVRVVGISTVFGNASRDVADRAVEQLLQEMSDSNPAWALHLGSAEPLPPKEATDRPAHRALRDALAQRELTIVALGPLTNIAAALRARPDLQQRVTRVIAVMGRRPGHMFHPTEGADGAMLFGHGPVFSDLNFASDPLAATEIVRMGVPLVLIPYEAARHVELMRTDLEQMRSRGGAPAWIAEQAFGWLDYWRDDIGREGFYPFDLMAAIFTLRPDLMLCAKVPIRVGKDMKFLWPFRQVQALLAGPEVTADAPPDATQATGFAEYCPNVTDGLRDWLSAQLRGPRP
jgi:inosine-uridine nucleoside N-ribohydrolase